MIGVKPVSGALTAMVIRPLWRSECGNTRNGESAKTSSIPLISCFFCVDTGPSSVLISCSPPARRHEIRAVARDSLLEN